MGKSISKFPTPFAKTLYCGGKQRMNEFPVNDKREVRGLP